MVWYLVKHRDNFAVTRARSLTIPISFYKLIATKSLLKDLISCLSLSS